MSVIKINLNEDNNVTNTITNNNINNVVNNSQSSQKNTKADKLKYMAQFSEFNEFEKDYREQYGELWKNAKQYNAKQQTEIINITIGKAAMHLGLLWDWIRDDRYLFGFYRKGSNNKDMIIKVPYDFKFKTLHDKIMDWYKKIKDGKNQKKPSIVVNETFNNEIQAQEDNINDAINDLSYIQFEDPIVEQICHEKLHVYTYEDAKKIIKLDKISGFLKSNITSFNELKYFTNLKKINDYAFATCSQLKQITLPDSITEIGMCAFSGCTDLLKINIPNNVTEIGDEAFSNCIALQQINIPNGITEIKDYTFCNCNSLQQINIPNNVTEIGDAAFSNCIALQQINIPNSVTKIGYYAFAECNSLQQINIPNGITKIKANTFNYCNSLQQINIPNNVTEIGNAAFSGCKSLQQINIPNGITEIGDAAFSNCIALQQINIPNNVTEIGDAAFSNCIALQQINIPNSVTKIGYYAFAECNSLQQINIPNGVTEIGDEVFENCSNLQMVTILSENPSLGYCIFDGCESLRIIYVSKTIYEKYKDTNFGKYLKIIKKPLMNETFNNEIQAQEDNINDAINDLSYIQFEDPIVEQICHEKLHVYTYEDAKKIIKLDKISGFFKSNITSFNELKYFTNLQILESTFEDCNYLKQITLPNSVIAIGNYAFMGCKSLQQINIPNSVTEIGEYAFSDCRSLQQINIPNGVTTIGASAFECCSLLNEINIPNGVTKIGSGAFSDCVNIKQITLPNSVIAIGNYAFWNCEQIQKINLPNGVTEIGPSAFYNCESLQQINIPNGVTKIGSGAFSDCRSLVNIDIPNSVTKIGDKVFENCSNLQMVTILSENPSLGYCIFDGCESLRTIYVSKTIYEKYKDTNFGKYLKIIKKPLMNETFNNDIQAQEDNIDNAINDLSYIQFEDPNMEKICHEYLHVYSYEDAKNCTNIRPLENVPYELANKVNFFKELKYFTNIKEIPDYTFCGYQVLSIIELPLNLKTIGRSAFIGCLLQKIDIPSSVTTIKEYAFSENRMLKKIIFHEGLQTIGDRAFTSNICQTIKIPDTVVSIGSDSFSQCDKLRKISFGINSQLDTISEACFSWCQHLKEVILPKNLKTIGCGAFNYCKLLKNIELPEGLKTIDDLAFKDSGIIDIRIPQTVTSIGKQTFTYCHYLKNIYAPGHLISQLPYYVIDKVIETPYHVVNETFNGQMQSERGTMSDDEWKKYQLDKLTKNLDNLIKSYLRRFCESEITETDKWGNSETYGTYDYDKFLDDFSEIIEQNTNFRFYGKLRIKDYGNKLHGGNHIIGLYDDMQGYAIKRKLDDFWYHMLAGYRRSSVLDFIKLIQTMIKNILPNQEDIDKVTEGLAKKYTENYKNESVNESVNNDKEIHFKDKEIKRICHEKLHVYTYEDARKIKKLKGVFRNNSIIKSFDEFKYFTGLKTLQTKAFENCKNLETITIPNSIVNLGNEIFYGRDKLKRINVPKNLYDEMKERYGDIVKKYQYKYSISKNSINETFNNEIQSQKDDINNAIEDISKIDAYKFKDDLKFKLENYVGDLEENDLGVIKQYELGVTIPLSDYLNSFPRNCNEIYLNIYLSIRNQYEAKISVYLMSENEYYYLQLDPSDPKKGSEKSFSLNAITDNNLFRLIHFLFNKQTRPGQNIECADFYIVQESVYDIIQFFIANSKNKWFVSLLSDDALNDIDDILWEDSDNIEYFHTYGYINDKDYNNWKISNEDLN